MRVLWSRGERLALTLVVVFLCFQTVGAQNRYAYSSGESVSPAYEGWWQNEDGSFTLFFGYMNTNWLEELDVPIGPDNKIEPGGPDQGQPTHFYPRRNPFLFTIRVPKDFGDKELVWSLTSHGKTERAYASLKGDYNVDPQVIQLEVGGDGGSQRHELRTNVPPDLRVEGGKQPTVKVGEPLRLVAFARDPDNLPEQTNASRGRARASGQAGADALGAARSNAATRRTPGTAVIRGNPAYIPPPGTVPSSLNGLRLSWIVYRGKAAAVTFSPEQMKTWMDTRPYANSPWWPGTVMPEPPPDGKWDVRATFQELGTYVLRAIASDSALFSYEDVTVTVTR